MQQEECRFGPRAKRAPHPAPRPPPQGLLRESQQASERLQKECGALAERAARLHHTLEEHIHANTQLLADNSQRQVGGGGHGSGARR